MQPWQLQPRFRRGHEEFKVILELATKFLLCGPSGPSSLPTRFTRFREKNRRLGVRLWACRMDAQTRLPLRGGTGAYHWLRFYRGISNRYP